VLGAAQHKAVPSGITTNSFKHWELRLLVSVFKPAIIKMNRPGIRGGQLV
jgi:hypothetical protein